MSILGASGSDFISRIDAQLSATSANPVQNRVVTRALRAKADAALLRQHAADPAIHVSEADRQRWDNATVSKDNVTITENEQGDIQTVAVRETNANNAQKIWVGTEAEYLAQGKQDSDDLCIITDDGTEGSVAWGAVTGDMDDQADLKAALDSKADLVGGKVPSGQLPTAYKSGSLSDLGGVRIDNTYNSGRYGLFVDSTGLLKIFKANYSRIDNNTNRNKQPSNNASAYGCIDTGTLDYAVRSVSDLITDIPASALECDLLDASATTNNHSYVYRHAPTEAPIYYLPAVTNTAIDHEIVLYMDMTHTDSFVFESKHGDSVYLALAGMPVLGETWVLWATYNSLSSSWVIRGMCDTHMAV